MTVKEMKKLERHYCTYLGQSDFAVLHPVDMEPNHVDVLKFPPTPQFPFWKLATMGASDYHLPPGQKVEDRNEYMMFVDKDEELDDRDVLDWYYNKLLSVALYAANENACISYGHSMDLRPDDSDVVAAYLEMPQVIPNPAVLRCKLGLFKKTACLQVVLLNQEELAKLFEIGPMHFGDYIFYPEDENMEPLFLCKKKTAE